MIKHIFFTKEHVLNKEASFHPEGVPFNKDMRLYPTTKIFNMDVALRVVLLY